MVFACHKLICCKAISLRRSLVEKSGNPRLMNRLPSHNVYGDFLTLLQWQVEDPYGDGLRSFI